MSRTSVLYTLGADICSFKSCSVKKEGAENWVLEYGTLIVLQSTGARLRLLPRILRHSITRRLDSETAPVLNYGVVEFMDEVVHVGELRPLLHWITALLHIEADSPVPHPSLFSGKNTFAVPIH